MMLTDKLLQLSMEEPLPSADVMHASYGVVIEPSGLVRRVEYRTHPVAQDPVARFGPLWMRVDALTPDDFARLTERAAAMRRKDHP